MFPLDNTLAMLSHKHRRKIMYVLTEADKDTFSYNEITQSLIDQDYLEELDEERFEVQMVHNHIPRMKETGAVDHDPRSKMVRYLENEDIENLLDDLKQYEE